MPVSAGTTDKTPAKRQGITGWDLAGVALLSCLPVTWFRGNHVIAYLDFVLPPHGAAYVHQIVHAWNPGLAPGLASPKDVAFLPVACLLGAGELLHLGAPATEMMLFSIFFAATLLGALWLGSVVGLNATGRWACALFYVFNPYALLTVWISGGGLIQPAYAAAPIAFAGTIWALDGFKPYRRAMLVALLWTIVGCSSYANPAVALTSWIPPAIYLFWNFAFCGRRLRTLATAVTMLFAWLIFNFFWFYPFVITLHSQVARSLSAAAITNTQTVMLNSIAMWDAARFLGYWAIDLGYAGTPYFTWGSYYVGFFAQACGWLTLVLAGAGVYFLRRRRAICATLILSALLALFFLEGDAQPFGFLSFWVLTHVGLLQDAFRNLLSKWGPVLALAYAPFIGASFDAIRERLAIPWARVPLVVTLGVLLYAVQVYPMWNGQVIDTKRGIFPSHRIDVPPYYDEAAQWLKRQPEGALLPLPQTKTAYLAYAWPNGFYGAQFDNFFLARPAFSQNIGSSYLAAMPAGVASEAGDAAPDLTWWFGRLGARFVVEHKDVDYHFMKYQPSNWYVTDARLLHRSIRQDRDLSAPVTFDKLSFYRVPDSFYVPLLSLSSAYEYWEFNPFPPDLYEALNAGETKAAVFNGPLPLPLLAFRTVLSVEKPVSMRLPLTGRIQLFWLPDPGNPLYVPIRTNGRIALAMEPVRFRINGKVVSPHSSLVRFPAPAPRSDQMFFIDGDFVASGASTTALPMTVGPHWYLLARPASKPRHVGLGSVAGMNIGPRGGSAVQAFPTVAGGNYEISASGAKNAGPYTMEVEDGHGSRLASRRIDPGSRSQVVRFQARGRLTVLKIVTGGSEGQLYVGQFPLRYVGGGRAHALPPIGKAGWSSFGGTFHNGRFGQYATTFNGQPAVILFAQNAWTDRVTTVPTIPGRRYYFTAHVDAQSDGAMVSLATPAGETVRVVDIMPGARDVALTFTAKGRRTVVQFGVHTLKRARARFSAPSLTLLRTLQYGDFPLPLIYRPFPLGAFAATSILRLRGLPCDERITPGVEIHYGFDSSELAAYLERLRSNPYACARSGSILVHQQGGPVKPVRSSIPYRRLNSDEYILRVPKIATNQLLEFRVSYDRHWELCDEHHQCRPPMGPGTVDYFANGWLLGPADSGKTFTLRMQLYDVMRLAALITVLGLAVSIGWLLFDMRAGDAI